MYSPGKGAYITYSARERPSLRLGSLWESQPLSDVQGREEQHGLGWNVPSSPRSSQVLTD